MGESEIIIPSKIVLLIPPQFRRLKDLLQRGNIFTHFENLLAGFGKRSDVLLDISNHSRGIIQALTDLPAGVKKLPIHCSVMPLNCSFTALCCSVSNEIFLLRPSPIWALNCSIWFCVREPHRLRGWVCLNLLDQFFHLFSNTMIKKPDDGDDQT